MYKNSKYFDGNDKPESEIRGEKIASHESEMNKVVVKRGRSKRTSRVCQGR